MALSFSPLVTAVITTHNRPDTLPRAIASINREEYERIECVVVDDASNLPEDILNGAERPTRLVRSRELGVAGARNLGLMEARGAYVICLDDDDIAYPNRIRDLVARAAEGYDLVYGFTRKSFTDASAPDYLIPTHPTAPREASFADLLTCMPHVNAMLAHAGRLREAGGYDPATPHFDEWSGWLRMADRGARSFFTGTTVADWYVHHRGLTGAVQRESAFQMRLHTLLEVVAQSVSEEHRRLVERAQQAIAGIEIDTYDDYVNAILASGGLG